MNKDLILCVNLNNKIHADFEFINICVCEKNNHCHPEIFNHTHHLYPVVSSALYVIEGKKVREENG